jgi:hypothetical protein
MAPEYLREASYRLYERASWRAGSTRDNFQIVPQETNNAAFVLVGKSNLMQTRITCYLENFSRESGVPIGLLPLPSGVGRLENIPVFVLKMNSLGAVLAEGPGLVSFNAAYGPGPTADAPFDVNERAYITNNPSGPRQFSDWDGGTNRLVFHENPDLFVHPEVRGLLQEVVADWNVRPGDRPHAIRAINQFFSGFTYSTWQDMPDLRVTNAMALFLTRMRSGHCEYFATATVLLLRQLGVPARYAVGYAVHEKSGSEYVVRLRDAHSWCLVWNERARTWQDFDTTPGTWIEAESKNASRFESLSDLWTWFGFQFAKFRWGQSNLRQYMLIGLIPVMGLLAYQIFFRRKHRNLRNGRKAHGTPGWPGLDSEFYLIEQKLARQGVVRRPHEPLSEWLERALEQPELGPARGPLSELVRLHYKYRFDPRGIDRSDRERLRTTVDACLAQMEAARRTAAH